MELSLGKVNILIGANGSGKSNFIRIFEFLSNKANEGLENAISRLGEIEFIRNVNISDSECLYLEILHAIDNFLIDKAILQKPYEVTYKLILEFEKNKQHFKVIEDRFTFKHNLLYLDDIKKENMGDKETKFWGLMELSDTNGVLSAGTKDLDNLGFSQYLKEIKLPIHGVPVPVYDLDPKLSKKAQLIFAKADLEEDGSNLVIVIKKILDDPEKKRMFLNLVTYLLPYIDDVKIDKSIETNLSLKFKETYSEKHYLPAPLISDGTINALGLIVALYFQASPLIIIEEPDRGFHPSLISRVVEMMKDAAKHGNKQIIVTTHNPIMIKHADPEDVFLVSRDKEGFSQIYKPIDKDEIRIFLENEMRLVDLYETSLLEI